VVSAQLSLDAAQASYADLVAGAKPADLDAAKSAVVSAQLSLQSAQLRLSDLQSGAKASDVAAAQASLASAQAALATKLAGASANDLADQQDAIAAQQANLDQARVNLQNAVLLAPFPGRVAAINAQAGEQVAAGGAVVTLLNANEMQVNVSVDETDITKIQVGQNVL